MLADPPPMRSEWKRAMDIEEAIRGRRAVREFTSQPVNEETLRQLIDAAVQAPQRRQPAAMAVYSHKGQGVTDAHFAGSESPYAQDLRGGPGIASFPEHPRKPRVRYILPCSGIGRDLGARGTMDRRGLRPRGREPDAGGARRRTGTCWIGFAQGWLGTPEGKSALRLAGTAVAVAPIIVGHPKKAAAPVARKPPAIDWIS
jgi:hypothetical protein